MFNRTLAPIRKQHQRDDRLKAKAAAVIDAMRRGQTLHRHHAWYGPIWWLSKDGHRISDEVAQLVIVNPAIVSVGDALPFNIDIPAQTWRYVERSPHDDQDH
jgi:hypothetical protein